MATPTDVVVRDIPLVGHTATLDSVHNGGRMHDARVVVGWPSSTSSARWPVPYLPLLPHRPPRRRAVPGVRDGKLSSQLSDAHISGTGRACRRTDPHR